MRRAAKRSTIETLALAVVLIFIGACGGDSSDDAMSTEEAEALARAALPPPDALPGGAWTATRNDDFTFEQNLPPAAACDPARTLFRNLAEDRLGRAQRRLERGSGPAVEVEVQVYRSNDGLDELLAGADRVARDPALPTCWAEVLKVVRNDPSARVTRSVASASPPHGGASYADDRDLAVSGSRVVVHAEVYWWVQKNVAVVVQIFAVKSGFTAELASSVLQRVDESLTAALADY
jgi:hypothetical protein